MANLQYIGARYVPKFYLNPDYPAPDTRNNDWKSGVDYEALTIVTYNNDSYTSKKVVPDTVGNPLDNPEYWACTTKYTAALIALQTTVGVIESEVDDLQKLKVFVTPEMYGAVGDGVHDDTDAIQNAVDSGFNVVLFNKTYLITDTINCSGNVSIIGLSPDSSKIKNTSNGFALKFTNSVITWHPCDVIVENLTIESLSGSNIEFNNITQGVIRNCHLKCATNTNIDNVAFKNESHYAIIDNCKIQGGNGIVNENANTSNGLKITNNYLTYCYAGITLYGSDHDVRHNDLEGMNDYPYVLHCNRSFVECLGERNTHANSWIICDGESNKIFASMRSDGVRLYELLADMTGSRFNELEFGACHGFTLITHDKSGEYNTIKCITNGITNVNAVLYNTVSTMATKNNLLFNPKSIIFDTDNGDDLTAIVDSSSPAFTYDPSTQIITFSAAGDFKIDFNLLSQYVNDTIYAYYVGEVINQPVTLAFRTRIAAPYYEVGATNNIVSFNPTSGCRYLYRPVNAGGQIKVHLKVALTPNT